MAKVTAPFLSLGATGSVAKTLTASVWKGIKTMRQKSNPANPRTIAQMAQRSKMAATVAAWRLGSIVPAVKSSWNLLATTLGQPVSGFNLFTRETIQALKASASAIIGQEISGSFSSPTFSSPLIAVLASDYTTVDLSERTFGCRAGFAPNQLVLQTAATGAETGGEITPAGIIHGLSAGETLYVQYYEETTEGEVALTGICEFTYEP